MNVLKILEAIEFASKRHQGQMRQGVESQMSHVLRVAKAVAEYLSASGLENTCGAGVFIISAILHDVLEDTPTTDSELAEKFGHEIAKIVRALSHESEEEPDEVYLRRVAGGGMVAIIVKRFDRLDNLRSLTTMPTKFRERKLAEVRAALPVWREIDPEGAVEIEQGVKSYE